MTRQSVLTLFGGRASELALPDEAPNPAGTGMVMRGFVERVGVPTPLVAPDGTQHLGAALTAEALDAIARTVGYGAPVSIAVPAHWSEAQFAALREALFTRGALTTTTDVPPVLIPDATAALGALYAKPGFPTGGVVALCDFGASGTNVTLTDAASNFQRIGSTLRYTEFSGDRIDQFILSHLHRDGAETADDHASTAPLRALSRRLDDCRRAKEQLSVATMSVVPAEMPGFGRDIPLSRNQFEHIIAGPLDRFVDFVEQTLQHNDVPKANLAAAAIVGGGACIPLITSRLSERLQTPIFTTAQPACSAAIGAAVLGQQRSVSGAPTAAGAAAQADTAVGQPTEVVPAAWAARAEPDADENDPQSATYRALAWSQEAGSAPEPVPYAADDEPGPEHPPVHPEVEPATAPRWYTRPALLLGVAGVAALLLVGGVVVAALELAKVPRPAQIPSNITPPVESSPIKPVSQVPSETGPTSTGPAIPPSSPWTTTMTTEPTQTGTTTEPAPTTQPTTRPTTTWATTTASSVTAPTTSVYPSVTKPWPQTTTPHGTATIAPPVPPVSIPPGYGY